MKLSTNKFYFGIYSRLAVMFMFRLLLYGERNAAAAEPPFKNATRSHRGTGEIFVAIIYPKAKEAPYSRAVRQAMASLAEEFTAATNLKVTPYYTAVSEEATAVMGDIEGTCLQWDNKAIVAALILSPFQTGFGHALAAFHNNIPVLWVTGNLPPGYFQRVPLSQFEVRLDTGPFQVLGALRSLLLTTHWHAFTIMHTTSLLASKQYKSFIGQPPLIPRILPFTSDSTPYYIFGLLSDISKSTKGVVVLICEGEDANKVMEESKKLNMMNGDFVWLWIDTGATLSKEDVVDAERKTRHINDTDYIQQPQRRVNAALALRHYPFHRKRSWKWERNVTTTVASAWQEGDRRKYRRRRSYEVPIFLETPPVIEKADGVPEMPVGLLSIRALPAKVDKAYVKGAVRLLIGSLKKVLAQEGEDKLSRLLRLPRISCFDFHPVNHGPHSITEELTRTLKLSTRESLAGRFNASFSISASFLEEGPSNHTLASKFKILNLIPEGMNAAVKVSKRWRTIGDITGEGLVHLETIVWPGGDIVPVSTGRGSRSIFRIVTAFAPPFVMIGELDEDGQCVRGIECHQFLTSDKDNLTLLFNEMERTDEEDEVNVLDRLRHRDMWSDIRQRNPGRKFRTNCCYGLSMDLLENIAEELDFNFQLYVVSDGLFGTKYVSEEGENKWNGIMGDLISGAAHMSFTALSVSSSRAQVIDFSVPFFFSGVSFLAAPKQSSDIPLLAFLLPFSPYLWIAIFISLHLTAIAVAIYEWLSPFGLNPWGRQRSKNFGLASAFWVVVGLLCGHTLQFKAPKSWPNKVLINVWGGFSVIFIASYTANIAALMAGLFFRTAVGDHHDKSLLSQKVGCPRASVAEHYVKSSNQMLWNHMQRYSVISVEEGVRRLKNGSLDILIGDTPILDYYRATDHDCKLQKVGDTINEDTYAIGMTKGFPLKDSISHVIAKYSTNGYMDILQEKWYGALPCFKLNTEMAQPRPLGVASIAGNFLMLGLGVVVGFLILCSEHLFYKYALPSLRRKPKTSKWRSRNVMFFSQKLYRFINCVELVSPHHAARELMNTLRQGQITSLFQKSVRRKENERKQRGNKAKIQFFEMIQEIRRVQQQERKNSAEANQKLTSPREKNNNVRNSQILSPARLMRSDKLSPGRLDFARRLSKDIFRSKSSGNLAVRPESFEISVARSRFLDFDNAQAIGRRLSRGVVGGDSPPDMSTRRTSHHHHYQQSEELKGAVSDTAIGKGNPTVVVRRCSEDDVATISAAGGDNSSLPEHIIRITIPGQDQVVPKISLHSPVEARCHMRRHTVAFTNTVPLEMREKESKKSVLSKLTREELLQLSQLSERDLKKCLTNALVERE